MTDQTVLIAGPDVKNGDALHRMLTLFGPARGSEPLPAFLAP
jgi:hypothetical protein